MVLPIVIILRILKRLYGKGVFKMCEKVLHMLKARRYGYLEDLNCKWYVSKSYRRLMEIKISVVTEIIEEIEGAQKQDDIIIA